MTYEFLTKAQSQPDLKDFCQYLNKPLSVLNEIKTNFEQLKSNDQNHLEIHHKIEIILDKHLPEMVDNYCNFSFGYRNSKCIEINNVSLTPKEILLRNLAKVIEEIELIEKDFNKDNSFNAIVQNKVLEDYGYKPELSLDSGKIIHNNLQLENKFDYENFIEANQFKKSDFIAQDESEIEMKTEDSIVAQNETIESISQKEKYFTFKWPSFSLLEIVLILQFFIIITFFALAIAGNSLHQKEATEFSNNMLNITSNIKKYYANSNSYEGLNNQHAKELQLIRDEQLVNPWDDKNQIKITATSMDKANDSMLIEVPLNKDFAEISCEWIMQSTEIFDIVKVGDVIVKNRSNNVSDPKVACASKNYKTISLIEKKG